LDFGETYATVSRLESIQILLAYVTHHDFKLCQMDVKSAFLNGPLSELVEQPPGFEDPKFPNHVYKFHKALYGLKQAPRSWYECLKDFLLKKNFIVAKADSTLFTLKVDRDIFVCQIYVDDIIFGSTDQKFCLEFSRIMTKRFEMSMMGELKFFLGFQVKQMKEETFLCQTKYVKDMLKKFDMADAKPIKTPMALNGHLDLNEEEKSVNQKVYHSMIGALLYLCASRLDIMLSVCMCVRFQANPKEYRLIAVKRILRYLVHTPNLFLWYPKGSTFDLLGYSDSVALLWQNRSNYSGSSALLIAVHPQSDQRTSNGTILWSVGSPPDTTTVQQDRSRFTSHEGEFTSQNSSSTFNSQPYI
jgi:hypothetical protein